MGSAMGSAITSTIGSSSTGSTIGSATTGSTMGSATTGSTMGSAVTGSTMGSAMGSAITSTIGSSSTGSTIGSATSGSTFVFLPLPWAFAVPGCSAVSLTGFAAQTEAEPIIKTKANITIWTNRISITSLEKEPDLLLNNHQGYAFSTKKPDTVLVFERLLHCSANH